MPTAQAIAGDPHIGPCPNCGHVGLPSLKVFTASMLPAWMGCILCYHMALDRGQLPVLQKLCQEMDAAMKGDKNIPILSQTIRRLAHPD